VHLVDGDRAQRLGKAPVVAVDDGMPGSLPTCDGGHERAPGDES
jgi:hypothetical protein